MIYYFTAIKSLVDTKAKDSLTPYPARPISLRPPRLGPELHFLARLKKGIFDFVDRGCGRKIMK